MTRRTGWPSEGYHIALAVALALARLAVPPAEEHEFMTAFLTRWGEALDGARRKTRKRSYQVGEIRDARAGFCMASVNAQKADDIIPHP